MNEHTKMKELIPFYAAGTLPDEEREKVAQHLQQCADCRAELRLWQSVSDEIRASDQKLRTPELRQMPLKKQSRHLWKAWYILRSQVALIRKEIWLSSALVSLLGIIVALLVENVNAIYFLAPFISAAGVAYIYGMQNDPALELTLATPISAQQILLARIALVFGYNIILTSSSSVLILLINGQFSQLSWTILLNWMAPMAFLSSLALFFSLLWGSINAVVIAYALWIIKSVVPKIELNGQFAGSFAVLIDLFKIIETPAHLLLGSLAFFMLTLWFTSKEKIHLLG
jgi:hypothetical protein